VAGRGAILTVAMRLRDVTDADLSILYEQQRDPDAAAMAHFASRDRDAFMEHWRTRVLGKATTLVKTIDEDGEVAGYVASWNPDTGGREVAYWLGRAFWGRGIATAALAAFLRDVDAHRPLTGVVAVTNVGSRRVLEKCGFVAEAVPSAAADGVMEVALVLRG